MGLTTAETDQLLMSAKFMPVQATNMLHEPRLVQLDDLIGLVSHPRDKQIVDEKLNQFMDVLKHIVADPLKGNYAPTYG
jgi:hypothetical protein